MIKFDPVSKSTTHIGPDFGDEYKKWYTGAITSTGSGIIYCVPKFYGRGILKIDTITDTVTELDRNLFPEDGYNLWRSFAIMCCRSGWMYLVHAIPCSSNHKVGSQ